MSSHIITIETTFRYEHGDQRQNTWSVSLQGDGTVGSYVQAFRTALMAAGFDAELAGSLGIRDE